MWVTDASLAAEMESAVWTAIGLVATTSLGTLFNLGSRIDALAARMDSGFDGLASRLDAHLDEYAS